MMPLEARRGEGGEEPPVGPVHGQPDLPERESGHRRAQRPASGRSASRLALFPFSCPRPVQIWRQCPDGDVRAAACTDATTTYTIDHPRPT